MNERKKTEEEEGRKRPMEGSRAWTKKAREERNT